MKWLTKLLGLNKQSMVLHQPQIQFLGEKDGPVEQEIKSRWQTILAKQSTVQRAYLAIVSYDQGASIQTALCLLNPRGEDPLIVKVLAEPYRQMFKVDQVLDVTFLRPEHEAQLQHVCRPFYEAA